MLLNVALILRGHEAAGYELRYLYLRLFFNLILVLVVHRLAHLLLIRQEEIERLVTYGKAWRISILIDLYVDYCFRNQELLLLLGFFID